MIGSFGDIVFEVSADKIRTFQNLSMEHKSTFASHNIIGAKQKLQHTGYELSTATLDIQLVATLGVNPKDELSTLSEMLASGDEYSFFLGSELLGKYVLESYSETYSSIDSKGNVFSVNVSLSLREYN